METGRWEGQGEMSTVKVDKDLAAAGDQPWRFAIFDRREWKTRVSNCIFAPDR